MCIRGLTPAFRYRSSPKSPGRNSDWRQLPFSLGVWLRRLEPVQGFEPRTYGLQNRCSTTELNWLERSANPRCLHINLLAKGVNSCRSVLWSRSADVEFARLHSVAPTEGVGIGDVALARLNEAALK